MTKSNVWKRNKAIRALKEELEKNKKTYENNLKLIGMKLELKTANLEYIDFEKKKHDLNNELIQIELKNSNAVNPIFEFHRNSDWQNKWKELKELELKSIELNYKTAEKTFENQEKKLSTIDEAKIKQQQEMITQRNPIILEQLKELGVNIDESQGKA